ncbi:MAG: TonB-dependent receptor [Campylobacterales bacterium]|nr:TonB-dependent receptor [Campylobacterales bacterium]
MNTKNNFCVFSLILLSCTLSAGEYHLDALNVEALQEGEIIQESVSKTSEAFAKEARGETLGDFLANEQFVDSASYGPAVGRPVVKGMDGYRVGVTNGNVILNDLSAMSQDHAVGVMPRSAEKIEFIKGPASLLYGNYSGGVVRVLGEEHKKEFLQEGVRAEMTGSYGGNGAGTLGVLKADAASQSFSASLSATYHEAEDYKDGNGQIVKDSDTLSQQLHGVLGYKIDEKNNIKVYFNNLNKEYGIPNTTSERTTIEMQQQHFGAIWHAKELFETFEYMQTEVSYSDYLHYEYEADSADGLFGQKQFNISNTFGLDFDSWHIDANIEYMKSDLEVCHEHGKCTDFSVASRSTNVTDGSYMIATTQDSDNPNALPFSHGHPMPNIDESIIKAGLAAKSFLNDEHELTFSLRSDIRELTPDSSNIQQEWLMPTSIDPNYYNVINDMAWSASVGWYAFLSDYVTLQTSLSYIQRLPSSTELFWNGFHHATNSYIMGDRYLGNEESYNFDLELMWSQESFTTQASVFYYDFTNYIYQTPLIGNNNDPINVNTISGIGHDALAWGIEGAGAYVYGAALKESYKKKLDVHKLEASIALEAIRGVLKDGGYIPRMPPFSATTSLGYGYKGLSSRISYKYVDESRFEGAYESKTPAYGWLSAYLEYLYKSNLLEGTIFVKAENITDEQAYNHLSFLKESAPYAGRQLTVGATLRF